MSNVQNHQMYSAGAIGNYFLRLAKGVREPINAIKLQKLVYYAAGWFAGYMGRPLIDEEIKAWECGPIIPSLFDDFVSFGTDPITARSVRINAAGKVEDIPAPEDPEIQAFLRNVWGAYRMMAPAELCAKAKAEGSPWEVVCAQNVGLKRQGIPFEVLHGHFKQAVERAKKEDPVG
jgi:uncharacterized phage-associated protein